MKELNKVVFLHTPKTGGGAMEYFFYEQFKSNRNYFVSFFGVDDSRFNNDELVTKRKGGNHCLIEGIFKNPELVEDFKNSPHFQQSKVLFGHTTYGLGELFPEYNFEYLTVLREPIERTISNIAQFSNIMKNNEYVKFGAHVTKHDKFSDEYWDFIYDVLTKEYPTRGLLVHENMYLRNCMTHILAGSKYLDVNEVANIDLALKNSENIKISFFDNFNEGIQKSFDELNISIDMSKNIKAKHGKPQDNPNKTKHGKYYNAPQKIIDFVIEHNQTDIKLYETLRSIL
jgi:hypothetical protein